MKTNPGRFFEDYRIGETIRHAVPRSVQMGERAGVMDKVLNELSFYEEKERNTLLKVKSALTYLDQSQGQYAPGEPGSVFQRGAINVKCQRGTPALGGGVYVRITANGSFSTAAVGGFEAEDDSGKVVQLTNCQWAGPADANGVAELRILTMNNA